MALQKNYNKSVYGQNINFNNAYIKIEFVSGNKEKVDVQVTIYNGDSKEYIVENQTYDFIPSIEEGSENFIKQGYEYLKTLPKYADAVDC